MASIIKVDTIQDQDGNNIISEAANTITIGASGDTITIPSGATLANSGIVTGFQSTGIDDNATSTAITIDSSERVLINQTSSISGGGVTGSLQLSGTNFNNSSVSFSNFGNDSTPSILAFNKSRSGVVGTTGTIVQNGDNVGNINWNADDGTDLVSNLARISGQIDGIPGANDTPGRLVFSTSSDGAYFPTERMRIDSSGNLLLNTTSQVSSAKLSLNGSIGLDRTSTYNQQWLQFISHTGTSNYGTLNFSPLNGQTTAGFQINDAAANNRFQIRGSGDSIKETVFNESGADFDFRVESNNQANMLFVDGGNDRIGIGTSSPSSELEVYGASTPKITVKSGDGTSASIKLQRVNENDASTDFELKNDGGQLKIIADNTSQNEFETLRLGSTEHRYFTNNTEAMRIDSSGKVGIGTTSPSAGLDVVSTNYPYIAEFRQANAGNPGQIVIDSPADNGARPSILNFETGGVLKWSTGLGYNDTNRSFHISTSALDSGITDSKLSITPSGNVKMGAVSGSTFTVRVTPAAGVWGIDAGTDASSFSRIRISSSGTASQTKMVFFNTNGQVGSITTSGTSTSYVTSSDYRLKENVNYDFDATTRLKQLRPARFNFIADADTTVDGFLAHEVQSVVPEAITGEKDAMKTEEYEVTPAVLDDDGNVITEAVMGTREVPDYQGIDQSKLVLLLVKTIQELEARITALETQP